jgi:hypothetical protein
VAHIPDLTWENPLVFNLFDPGINCQVWKQEDSENTPAKFLSVWRKDGQSRAE